MVQRAREPQHQPAADAPTVNSLPYDPEEWKQRVTAARAQREKVLRQRADGQGLVAEPQPFALSERLGLPVMEPPSGVPALTGTVQDEQPEAAGAIPYPFGPRQALAALARIMGKTPFGGRVNPMLFGLVIGGLAGASLVSLDLTRPGRIDLQNQSDPPGSSAGPSGNDAPSYTAPVAAPPLATSSPSLDIVPSADAQEPAFASLDVLSAPTSRGLELPVSATAAVAPSMPAISARPVASGQPSDGTSHGMATKDRGLAFREAKQSLSVSRPQLARLRPLVSSADMPNRRLAVYVPERLAAERRDQAMTQLSETGWSPEEASTPFTIGKTHVRYYHSQDRAAAEELAASLDIPARDFVSFTPSPAEGYLELWLGGQGAPSKPEPVFRGREMPVPVQANGAKSGSQVPQTTSDAPRQAASGGGDNEWLRASNSRNLAGVRNSTEGNSGSTNGGTGDGRAGDRGGSGGGSGNGGGKGKGGDGNGSGSAGGNGGSNGNGNGNGGGHGNGGGNGNGNSGGQGNGGGGNGGGSGNGGGNGNGGGGGGGNDGGKGGRD